MFEQNIRSPIPIHFRVVDTLGGNYQTNEVSILGHQTIVSHQMREILLLRWMQLILKYCHLFQ